MNLGEYFKRARQIEAELCEDHVVVVSLETADGGKAGVLTEVSRANAARLILDGRARTASKAERNQYRKQ